MCYIHWVKEGYNVQLFSKNLENVYKKFVINYFKRLLVESESRFWIQNILILIQLKQCVSWYKITSRKNGMQHNQQVNC